MLEPKNCKYNVSQPISDEARQKFQISCCHVCSLFLPTVLRGDDCPVLKRDREIELLLEIAKEYCLILSDCQQESIWKQWNHRTIAKLIAEIEGEK